MKRLIRFGRLGNRSGMTLIEMLFSVLLTAMICASLWAVSGFAERLKTESQAQIQLTNQARLAMERILWGYKPAGDVNAQRDGVREADTFAILNGGTELSYTDSAGSERHVRLNGVNIEYQEPGMAAWDTLYAPEAGSDPVTTLLFTASAASADVVVVDLVIGQRIRERWFNASIQSKIAIRN